MKKKVLHGYVLQHSTADGWHLLTSFGAMVGVWGNKLSKTAAVTMAVWLMHEFANRGQHSELRIRNKNGKFGPARTYPRSADPRRSRG